MKFFVLKGIESTIGTDKCNYQFYDIVEFDNDDLYEQMRKYAYREFYEMGAPARSMRETVYSSEKHIILKNNKTLSKTIAFHHTHSFFMFANASDFVV
jgi:hypothetical protein